MLSMSQAPNFLMAAILIGGREQIISLSGSSPYAVEDPDW
jgi:hypothetical protein